MNTHVCGASHWNLEKKWKPLKHESYRFCFLFQRVSHYSYTDILYFPRRIPRGEILDGHRRRNKFVYFLSNPPPRPAIVPRRLSIFASQRERKERNSPWSRSTPVPIPEIQVRRSFPAVPLMRFYFIENQNHNYSRVKSPFTTKTLVSFNGSGLQAHAPVTRYSRRRRRQV